MVMSVVGSTTTATSNLNVQTVSDFWMFVVYCLVVVVVVIFFLFYFNRALGYILTWLINQYTWRRFNAYIEVDSIRVTLLGARILFKNLRYLSTNQSISIVKGHISIQYWLLNVRNAEIEKQGTNQSKLPCRIVCNVQGLEWFIYNNIPAYEAMSQILGLGTPSSSPSSSSTSSKESNAMKDQDPESQVFSPGVEASLLRRLMPIQFECTTGAVMIGNNELRSMIVGELVQANGIWSTMAPRVEMDQYKSVLDLVLRSPRISLKDNMDYVSRQEPVSFVEVRKRSSFFHSLWSGVSMPFRKLFHPATRTRQFGHMQHMHDLMHARYQESDTASNRSTTFHEEYARVNNLLECSKMKIRYYADVPGPVPSTAAIANPGVGIDVGNGGLPPEWGVRVSVWNAMIHYGPWTDRQRTSIQDYFYPNSHRNVPPTPYRQPGEPRVPTAFEFLVDFETEATLRIPTRERSKDWRYDSGAADLDLGADGFYTRPYGWIDIKAAAGSSIKSVTPYVSGADGSTSTIELHLKKVDASTSVNYASLITAKAIDFHTDMPSPLVWNAHREWTIGFSIEKPRVFLLRDHVFLFQDLVKDWTSSPPPDILHFIPVTYTFNAIVSDPLIYLCVNEHNIISNPNSLEDNAYIKLHSQKLHFNMKLPFTDYEPEVNIVKFRAALEHVKIGISLQTSHTLHAFLEEENAQFGVAVNVTIDGSYEYYNTVDVLHHIESLNLDIKLNGVICKLFGTVIRYLIILRDNYVGAWVNFSTIDEYRQRRQNQREYLEMKKKQADAKPIDDPFEAYILVDVQDGSLLLPENLYDCTQYSQMDFQELQVELRNLDIYMDMYVNVSPITWTRESYVDPSSKKAFIRTRNVRDRGNYLYIDELNIYAHRLFGPLPDVATYLCHWEFEVGRIFGEVKPSFLLGTASFGQTFVYDMIDEDNAVPAEVAPAADPDVTFVKTSIKEIDVYLINENSAVNACLSAGLNLNFDNLVNEKYNQRISVHIPEIVATAVANQEDYTKSSPRDEFSWVEVARMNTGMDLTIFRHSKEWKRLRKAQQNFIRAQDNPTRRCTHLYNKEQEGAQRENHVGVLYAPLYQSFHTVNQDDALCAKKTSELSPFGGFSRPSEVPSSSSYIGDWAGSLDIPHRPNHLQLERHSMRSGPSMDNESFHTAYSGDDLNLHAGHNVGLDEIAEAYEQYSAESASESDADNHFVTFSSAEEKLTSSKSRETAIPPSIPYSGYLNRYSVKRAATPGGRSHGFFHPYLPPPQTRFEALKDEDNKRDSGLGPDFTETGFLFPESKDYPEGHEDILGTSQKEDSEEEAVDDDDSTGNEVIVTTVLEATKPLQILMTPILVKIVQEVTETINRYDWDLETMLDTLQIDYVGQLTRYLTERFVCTRFAVSLPGTHFHFIQNVMLPDDLPSYKDGRTYIKTQYDSEESMLCSADVVLRDFSMIGSVRFEDLAYDEKKKSVAESKMVLRESRVHIDLGHLNCKVYYVGARHDQIHQPIMFGIPQSRRHSALDPSIDEDDEDVASKLLMIDLELSGFLFRWLGATKPNYFNLEIDNLSTIIITEAVEILAGAVYSWLAFVDDLKAILENFQEQRSRLIQLFINELANYSQLPAAIGDPLFLTKPTNVLRLGSRNFRNDVGWKLLARMRYCLRTMNTGSRASLQFRLSKAVNAGSLDSKSMFDNVVEKFSLWRSWEISKQDISQCRLFTQPFKQRPLLANDREPLAREDIPLDPVAEFLISSMNLAKVRIKSFDFCIFEEEQEMDDNSIVIDNVDFLLDSVYKRPLIGSHEEERVIKEKPDSRLLARDGYLDVVAKAGIDTIKITLNPAILAFARHMLTVQRVFTTKLRSLSHATRTASSNSLLRPPEEEFGKPFDFQKILKQVDIVAQALVSVQEIDICARAQKLTMQSLVRKIQGSALFSNPKLTPLPLFASSDKADSDTGSGVRSSTKASRRNASSAHSNRLIFEAAGGIDCVDIRFYEILTRNHPLVNELLVISLEGVNVNSNISQPARSAKKQSTGSSANTKDILNVFSNIHKFNVHAPQRPLRLYSFVEDWRAEQGQRYVFLFQNLLTEWEEQRKVSMPTTSSQHHRSSIPVMKYDIKLQFLLNKFGIHVDLLPSLSVEYNISDFFVLVQDTVIKGAPVQKYAVQLAKQELHLITKNSNPLAQQQKQMQEEYSGGTFSIPGIRSTGSIRSESQDGVTILWLKSRIFVDYISLTLNVNMIDSLLTTQSLVGNEISELLEVLSYDKRKRRKKDLAVTPSASQKVFKYGMDISLKGLRISADSPAATGVFESNVFEACISNRVSGDQDRLLWSIKGHKFALSLEHNNEALASKRRNRLAYIVADFEVQNHLPGSGGYNLETYYIDFKRIQTVMQPIALGKLAEMYIYYDAELKMKKEQKRTELDRLTANTKRLVSSFKREAPGTHEAAPHSLLEGKVLSLNVRRLGLAIPLDQSSVSDTYHSPKETSALLLSIASMHFLTKDVEKTAAQLSNISLQFVKRFDQNNEEHFSADKHPRMNQMQLPSIACHVYTKNEKPRQLVKIDAEVGGFEVDIDGAFSEYLNALSVIYVKSKDRVDAFANLGKSSNESNTSDIDSNSASGSDATNHSEIVYLDVEGSFKYKSGTLRMYPKRHSGEAQNKKQRSGNEQCSSSSKDNSSRVATVVIPGLTAWVTYQTPLGRLSSVSDAPRRIHGDIMIHESDNTLHPSLVQFLQEVIAGLKFGMQKSSERKAVQTSSSSSSSATLDPNINASLVLRLSSTKLHLSCQPASKVVCTLSWNESEFLMNSFTTNSTLRSMSCVGSLRNVSVVVKHHFSPEPCLTASIDQVLLNAMLISRRRQYTEGGDDISIAIRMPTVMGDLNVRHLQDIFILDAYWFTATPDAPEQQHPRTDESSTSAPKPFARYVAIQVESIILSADLGQAIGIVTAKPSNMMINTHNKPGISRGANVHLDSIDIVLEGRLSGNAQFKQIALCAVSDVRGEHMEVRDDAISVIPSLRVYMDGFSAIFEYEYQQILDMLQDRIEFNVRILQSEQVSSCNLVASIVVEPLLACVSIKTVPVIVTMYKRLTELVEKKKLEAGLSAPSSSKFEQRPPQKQQQQRQVFSPRISLQSSHLDVRLDSVQLIVYPSQFQDVDNVEVHAQNLRLVLDQQFGAEETNRQMSIHLHKAALLKSVPGDKLLAKRDAKRQTEQQQPVTAPSSPTSSPPPAATTPVASDSKGTSASSKSVANGVSIFGIPSTTIQMDSVQQELLVKHTFTANFGGRINVSLNLGLIRYLQELVNMFNEQMGRAKEDRRIQPTSSQETLSISKPAGEQQAADEESFDSGVGVRSPSRQTSHHSLQEEETEGASPLVYTSEVPVNFNPQLQIMGDATPPMEWLGLKRDRLPAVVHEDITLVLDEIVQTIWQLYLSQQCRQ